MEEMWKIGETASEISEIRSDWIKETLKIFPKRSAGYIGACKKMYEEYETLEDVPQYGKTLSLKLMAIPFEKRDEFLEEVNYFRSIGVKKGEQMIRTWLREYKARLKEEERLKTRDYQYDCVVELMASVIIDAIDEFKFLIQQQEIRRLTRLERDTLTSLYTFFLGGKYDSFKGECDIPAHEVVTIITKKALDDLEEGIVYEYFVG